jgi:hypothetical protein
MSAASPRASFFTIEKEEMYTDRWYEFIKPNLISSADFDDLDQINLALVSFTFESFTELNNVLESTSLTSSSAQSRKKFGIAAWNKQFWAIMCVPNVNVLCTSG